MSWLLDTLTELLRSRPVPGTPEHKEAAYRAFKERSDERAKPPGQRDEARLLELDKRVVRLRIQSAQVRREGAALTGLRVRPGLRVRCKAVLLPSLCWSHRSAFACRICADPALCSGS